MLKTITAFYTKPGAIRVNATNPKVPLTYEVILSEIRILRSDPLCGTGKWTWEEELANHLFKRFKFVDPTKTQIPAPVMDAAPAKPLELKQVAK